MTKKNSTLFIAILAAMTMFQLNSCTKDNAGGGSGNNNNVNGIEFNMRNNGEELQLLEVDSAYHGTEYYPEYFDDGDYVVHKIEHWYRGHICLVLNSSNNFEAGHYYHDFNFYEIEQHHCEGNSIASVGTVNGLRGVTTIPQSGWAFKIAARPGNGYVIRYCARNQWHYARIYVVDWLESTNGGIIGATIQYQDHWKVEPYIEE